MCWDVAVCTAANIEVQSVAGGVLVSLVAQWAPVLILVPLWWSACPGLQRELLALHPDPVGTERLSEPQSST